MNGQLEATAAFSPLVEPLLTLTNTMEQGPFRLVKKFPSFYETRKFITAKYSCESQIITVCEDISDSIDEATRLDAIIIDFSKVFDLVPHDRPLKKLQPRVWIKGWSYGLGNF